MRCRIQKILSSRGVASRRTAEKWIAEGRVTVNGECASLGSSADPENDVICIDGVALPCEEKRVVIALNKPRGYITTMHDEKGRKTVAELVSACGYHVFPIGRLDMESDGLLLLTNDGDLANRLCHPSGEKRKTYRVRVQGFSEALAERLAQPMTIDGYALRPVEVRKIGTNGDETVLEFVLTEGRNRQIRKMCDCCGLRVLSLTRVQYAGIALGRLPKGAWRILTEEELAELSSGPCKNE
ncbi:MAG: rRNA pseudouridine synthase [Oscillospiraceae bacterium]|nr:rRNA pseudouridine synthase [Oscillospiraceae bacterium]